MESALLLGARRSFAAGLPLAESCSVAIAAAYHIDRVKEGDDVVQKPLKLGVVPVREGAKHFAFSSHEVELPRERDLCALREARHCGQ